MRAFAQAAAAAESANPGPGEASAFPAAAAPNVVGIRQDVGASAREQRVGIAFNQNEGKTLHAPFPVLIPLPLFFKRLAGGGAKKLESAVR